jgi:hypothetical protein
MLDGLELYLNLILRFLREMRAKFNERRELSQFGQNRR